MESVALTFTVTDMMQTRGITASCSEVNPIIGECGQRLNMYVYFVSAVVLEMVAVRLMPTALRGPFLAGWAGAEGATIWDNSQH